MNLIDKLLIEHALLYSLLDRIEAIVARAASPGQIQAALAMLEAVLIPHSRVEEELLFPALAEEIGPQGPVMVMRHEHQELDTALRAAASSDDLAHLERIARQLVYLARDHFAKEENILFPLARARLDGEILGELGSLWARSRDAVASA